MKAEAKKILVVEDEPSIRQLLLEILTSESFDVDVAAHGTEAKQRLNNGNYDLFIIDIKMPGMSGMELYNYIYNAHSDLLNRIIFTSGDVIGGDTGLFLERTGSPFLAKPFNSKELIAVVKNVISGAK